MKGRVEWIDISKGIGIILVVLGHAPTDDALKSFIFSFHMPMFFSYRAPFTGIQGLVSFSLR
ncbi:hypothetical protein [Bacillus atrophaeus]|uniref:hypothetical protein n=1 Tax=Bacillus atrophaeus TaxID=1452 RepID=UPI000305D8BD|nr:hypothetical protein [Bacillus atrophaeus]